MNRKSRKRMILLAVLAAVFLYAAGLLSGLSFSKYIEDNLNAKSEQDMNFLVEYVQNLDDEIQSAQIQENFINSLPQENTCRYADVYFSQLSSSLDVYWSVLPTRIEQFEKDNVLTQDYVALKKSYTKLMLRAWIISRQKYSECDTKIIPILYFYSKNCSECVSQGETLDSLKKELDEDDKVLIAFTIDYEQDEPALDLIKQYYEIRELPALIINDDVLQGRLFSESEIKISLAERVKQ